MNRIARDTPEDIIKYIPSRRIGTWEDMAGAAVFLASRAGDYVVGETIIVDGGVAKPPATVSLFIKDDPYRTF
jgi:NAD(P)-dependent dehydrogenase (short-subunit alcohol dehydrogenase family)